MGFDVSVTEHPILLLRSFVIETALFAHNRGTPIQNRLEDLYSLIKFLGLQPFDSKQHFNHFIMRPIKAGNVIGVTRLQTLTKSVTLRRTKQTFINGKPILSLPERKDIRIQLTLTEEERAVYEAVKERSVGVFKRLEAEGTLVSCDRQSWLDCCTSLNNNLCLPCVALVEELRAFVRTDFTASASCHASCIVSRLREGVQSD